MVTRPTKPRYSVGDNLIATDSANRKERPVRVVEYIGNMVPQGSSPFELCGHCYLIGDENGHRAKFSERKLKRTVEAA